MARVDRSFLMALGACSLMALAVLWVPKYLPLTDLPQQAAQISIWKHLADPSYGFGKVFQVHYFTPYLLANVLARIFAEAFSILVAVKLVLTLAVLGLPLSLWRLLAVARGDRWWALLGFPLAFGYSFLWGFFSYVVAIPLGVFYVAQVLDYREKLGARRALGVALLTVLLFATHLLPFMMCGLSAAVLLGLSAKDFKSAALRLAPLLPGLALAIVWATRYREDKGLAPNVFQYGLTRLLELPSVLFGYEYDWPALLLGSFAALLFGVSGARLANGRERWLPWVIAAVAYFAVPRDFSNVAFLYPRLAIWMVPFAFVATELGEPRVRPKIVHGALVCVALAWMGPVFASFYGFDREGRQFDVLLEQMQPNKRLRSLIFERGAEYTPGGAPFLHFPVWYQVEKGGTTSFTFATSSLSVATFRPEVKHFIPPGIDWLPWRFNAAKEQNRYDYFVVRASRDLGPELFRGATRRVRLIANAGWWWLYGTDEVLPMDAPTPAPG